jgi:nucleoside-diphosphate-sugar epimerase
MRILVTGAAGFIGSHLSERLIADGHEVLGLDAFIPYYPRETKERNIEHLLRHDRFELVEADLRYANLAPYINQVDAVIHEAAMAGSASWDHFDLYNSCNLTATQRLLEAVRTADRPQQRFIQISTSSVYGVEALGNEEAALKPASPYGITKLAAEQLAMAYGRNYGIPVVALRYFSIYGPRQRPDMAYNIFIDALLRDEPITIFGDGEQTRGNTYIDDCVDGTVSALLDATPGEAYNLGGGKSISLNRAIDILEDAVGRRSKRRYIGNRPGDQRHTLADCTKAHASFGYAPHTDPEMGLREQVAWQRCQRERLHIAPHYDASDISI